MQGRGPLLSLQVLRAVAALLVLVHHAGYDADTIAARRDVAGFALDRVFDWGFGIHLFFVISGFIMLRTAAGFGSPRGAAVFMLRRIVRVVPLYWLLTTLVLIGAGVAPGLLNTPLGDLRAILGSYGFVPIARSDGDWQPVLGQGWTLDYEMLFYGLFAAAMLLPRRAGLAALAGTLVGLVLIGHVVRPATVPLLVWTDGLLLEFLFGLMIGVAEEMGLGLSGSSALALAMTGALAAIVLGPLPHPGEGSAPWLRGGVPAAFIVAGCVLGPRWPRRGIVLAAAILGDASYSLYLSHPFVIRLLRNAWLACVPRTVPLSLYLAVSGLAATAAAILLHRLVERPMTQRLQRITTARGDGDRPILPDSTAAGTPARG